MHNPELIIILLNISILSFSYFWFFPRIAGANAIELAKYDFISFVVALSISAFLFYGSYIEFDALFFTLDWFWFSVLSFFTFEIPFALWYFNKHDVWDSLN
ncbi:hypothetical protein FJR48_07800 [Sulfurimonas lithotrophica]|uniref:Uncharacterized protein n=1 Tax=Sulfurimonas lithotrophica TaxID=2590022 RepID=A0A5P8P1N4_9BACT|nr:hypothetical protein [Sulfurimonas lithotrophica]QFR49638.1 hypothetical protein FJR48_07800 [Sulfurimonas lithotrophica]